MLPDRVSSAAVAEPRGYSALLWAALVDALQSQPADGPHRVLDCGGGSGTAAVPLAVLGAEVTVVDVSIDALGTLRRRATESGVIERVRAVQGEAEHIAELIGDDRFELILVHDVLDSVSDPADALRQLASLLTPGGAASIVVANPVASVIARALNGDVAGALATQRRRPGPLAVDVDSLIRLCAELGLQVELVEGIDVFRHLVPGIELERPGVRALLLELEAATAGVPPYRDIAARLHLLARRGPVPTG